MLSMVGFALEAYMSQQFTIDLDDHQDALADLLEALAARHVDLRTIAIAGTGRRTTVVLMTSDDAVTHEILRAGHYVFCGGEAVITSVPDEPGALAQLLRVMSHAGITVRGLSLLRWHQGKAELAFSSDDLTALRHLLGGYHVDRLSAGARAG
jgi:hypothetical protein